MAADLSGLTADTRAKVLELLARAADAGITLAIRSGRRTCAEQAEQFALGRTVPGTKVSTFAQGCQSWHVQGRAVDVDITAGPKDYGTVGALWKELGGQWGGDFTGQAASLRDVGHLEYHPGLSIADTCPNPAVCVDTPADGEVLAEPFPWGKAAFAAVGLVGVVLVTRRLAA